MASPKRNDPFGFEYSRHGAGVKGDKGDIGPTGPAGSAPTGTLSALTPANRYVVRLPAGITVHDGTQPSAEALIGGGMCVTGGSAAATATYYANGALAPVGATGWPQGVPLYPNASGVMMARGSLSGGIWSAICGTYDGANFSVGTAGAEYFP